MVRACKMVFVAATLAASWAQAAVIYSEDFSGSGSLNGTTPDIGGPTTWVGNSVDLSSGQGQMNANSDSAFLPVSIQSGYTYTLTAKVTATNNWVAVGFASASNGGNLWHTTAGNDKYGWALVRPTGSGKPQFFKGANTTGGADFATNSQAGTQTVVITLDTTSANWTVQANIAGNLSTLHTYTGGNSAIQYVGFGTAGGGSIDSFTLEAVPEPGSAALLGGLGILVMRRRR